MLQFSAFHCNSFCLHAEAVKAHVLPLVDLNDKVIDMLWRTVFILHLNAQFWVLMWFRAGKKYSSLLKPSLPVGLVKCGCLKNWHYVLFPWQSSSCAWPRGMVLSLMSLCIIDDGLCSCRCGVNMCYCLMDILCSSG